MKKSLFILAVAVFTLLGFNIQAKNNGANNPGETVSQKEEKATVHINKQDFLNQVWDYENSPQEWKFKGDKPVLIDFYADWCGPCRKAAPILEEIAKEYKGKIDVYKINTDQERELAGVFQVSGIPAFLLIPMDGKPTMTSGIGRTDAETKARFEQFIKEVLKVKKEDSEV